MTVLNLSDAKEVMQEEIKQEMRGGALTGGCTNGVGGGYGYGGCGVGGGRRVRGGAGRYYVNYACKPCYKVKGGPRGYRECGKCVQFQKPYLFDSSDPIIDLPVGLQGPIRSAPRRPYVPTGRPVAAGIARFHDGLRRLGLDMSEYKRLLRTDPASADRVKATIRAGLAGV